MADAPPCLPARRFLTMETNPTESNNMTPPDAYIMRAHLRSRYIFPQFIRKAAYRQTLCHGPAVRCRFRTAGRAAFPGERRAYGGFVPIRTITASRSIGDAAPHTHAKINIPVEIIKLI